MTRDEAIRTALTTLTEVCTQPQSASAHVADRVRAAELLLQWADSEIEREQRDKWERMDETVVVNLEPPQ